MIATILHVTGRAAWERAQAEGVYTTPELARGGFLHCCTEAQLPFVLVRHFAGTTGLVVLDVDMVATAARVEWVHTEPGQDPFPHLFGGIPADAVVRVRELG